MLSIKKPLIYFDRNTLLHLRLPFSFFLLPVFCFAISQTSIIDPFNALITFIALHFFIYPGSNIYNSYMDEDKGSIGGLKNPPPVTRNMYYVSMIFDLTGLLLSAFIGIKMVLLMTLYILVSKAYSWKKIRLKKYAFAGWLIVMLFQGGFTFLLVNMAAESNFYSSWFGGEHLTAMLLASLLIGGYYPLTQIYQHEEDSKRGDLTISCKLGITGTFVFSAVIFILAFIVAWKYFQIYYTLDGFKVFVGCLIPVIVYFFYWMIKTLRNKSYADYRHAMTMTFVSSCCMTTAFIVLFFMNH